ncbi:MAG: AMP-binding protein, partial [Anaerovorax sp.]|nr:AMP-binding protein [Anaerovorax sp.]
MTMQFNGPSQDLRSISTLKEMLDTSAELYANNPAFLVKKEKGSAYEEINYTLLKHDVDSLGTKLIDLGLQGEKIAVIGENCYEWIVSYLAVSNGTGIVVPLDKELSQEEIYQLLEISGCKGIFFTAAYEDFFKEYNIPIKIRMKIFGDRTNIHEELPMVEPEHGIYDWASLVKEGESLLLQGNHSFIDAKVDPDEMRILLFTSGTTETAKGVMLSQRNIATNIMDTCRIAHVFPDDRTLSILPIHHTFECTMGQLLVLYRGASTAYYEGLKYIVKNLAEAKATVLIGVPLIFESIYDKIWKKAEKSGKAGILRKGIKINRTMKAMGVDLSRKIFKDVHNGFGGKLRLIITGAAGIDPNVCRGFEDFGFRVLQGYGLTECSPLVSGPPDYANTYKKAGSVGPSVESGEIQLVDKDEDGIGEIIFKGPNVMLGYY